MSARVRMRRDAAYFAARPWRRENCTPTQWLRKHQGCVMSTLMALADPRVRYLSAEAIVFHVREVAIPGPGWIHGHALKQSADHEAGRVGATPYAARLREAAELFEQEHPGERPPAPRPAPTNRLRRAMEALLPPQDVGTRLTAHEIVHGLGTAREAD